MLVYAVESFSFSKSGSLSVRLTLLALLLYSTNIVFLLLILDIYGHGSRSFCLTYIEKKRFGQVEQTGKTDLLHAKRVPFRNLLPFYDNLDTLGRML